VVKVQHAMPEVAQLRASARWDSIDFISDLHLSALTPATFAAWREYLLGTAASAVFILGDLFEAWIGDDARGEGFEADAAAVLTAAAARCSVWFMPGNRDFLVGPAMLEQCGVHSLADPTRLHAFGTDTLLTHGDQFCIDDLPYQRFRAQVRDPAWQVQVLSRPLAERRALARDMRAQSAQQHEAARGLFSDADPLCARDWMDAAHATTLVHGHTHRPASHTVDAGRTRHVLSDWDLDHPASARAEVLRWCAAGWSRLTPAQALDPAGR
jgi:UDP-2,3-diacylglucosamine hydrolase